MFDSFPHTMRGSWCWKKILSFVVVVWEMMMTVVVENLAAKTRFKLHRHKPRFRIMVLASFAFWFAHLSAPLLVCQLICSFVCSLAHLPACSLDHLFAHLPTLLLIWGLVSSLAYWFAYLPSCLLICLLVGSFTRSFLHLPTCSLDHLLAHLPTP